MKLDLVTLWRYSHSLAEGGALSAWVLRLRYLADALRYRSEVAALMATDKAKPFLVRLRLDPRLAGFFLWPFLNASWSVIKRFEAVVEHHDVTATQYPWANLSGDQTIELLTLDDKIPGLKFILEHAPWFVREGCLNFSLMLSGERLMTLSFSLARREGDVVALVGSIQGSARADVVETYKQIAEAMNDTRPRDLQCKVFRLFLESCGIAWMRCIRDQDRASNHPFFGDGKGERVKLRYDELWTDQGGVLDNDGFFAMPSKAEDRPISDVPAKKRGRYKRRLEMYGDIKQRLDSVIAKMQFKRA